VEKTKNTSESAIAMNDSKEVRRVRKFLHLTQPSDIIDDFKRNKELKLNHVEEKVKGKKKVKPSGGTKL